MTTVVLLLLIPIAAYMGWWLRGVIARRGLQRLLGRVERIADLPDTAAPPETPRVRLSVREQRLRRSGP